MKAVILSLFSSKLTTHALILYTPKLRTKSNNYTKHVKIKMNHKILKIADLYDLIKNT